MTRKSREVTAAKLMHVLVSTSRGSKVPERSAAGRITLNLRLHGTYSSQMIELSSRHEKRLSILLDYL